MNIGDQRISSLIALPLKQQTYTQTNTNRVKLPTEPGQWVPLQVLASLAAAVPLAIMERACPDTAPSATATFRTPLVPWVPGAATFFNFFLLAQLPWEGLWMVGAYVLAALLLYFLYGYRHSVGATSGCVLLSFCWM